MENKMLWYAVMTDNTDTDLGTGSFGLAAAQELLNVYRADYPDAYIAVIDANCEEQSVLILESLRGRI